MMPVSAITISEAVIELSDDNSGRITATYTLSDHERDIVSSESLGTMNLAKELIGLNEDGTGTYSFTEENMTQYANMNG